LEKRPEFHYPLIAKTAACNERLGVSKVGEPTRAEKNSDDFQGVLRDMVLGVETFPPCENNDIQFCPNEFQSTSQGTTPARKSFSLLLDFEVLARSRALMRANPSSTRKSSLALVFFNSGDGIF